MPSRPRVALLIESSRGYGRGVLRGVAAYLHTHGPWSIDLQERRLADPDPPWLKSWRGDGVLARLDNVRLTQRLETLRVPIVGLSGAHDLPRVTVVQTPDESIVRLALTHLRERGFERFAFCGFPDAFYSDLRQAEFLRQTTDAQAPAFVFRPVRRTRARSTSHAEQHGMKDRGALSGWLAGLPKPIGLLACNDLRAQLVLEVCRQSNVAVPDEVAVVGVDDDELICDLCDPALSSVRQDTFTIGFRAAALLDSLMRGGPSEPVQADVEPLGVSVRASTDTVALVDRQIVAAVRFIREHARRNIRVNDVARAARLSRSTLERRFAALLRRSPKEEIDRVRMGAIQSLLDRTDLKLDRVAALVGFGHTEYLIAFVKHHTGLTPGVLRRQLRAAAK